MGPAAGAILWRHPYSRMAWRKAGRGAQLYVNGQDHALPVRDAKRIANAAQLDGAAYAALSEAGRDRVFELLQAGHYRLAVEGGMTERKNERHRRPSASNRSNTKAPCPTCAACARPCSCRNRTCRWTLEWDELDPLCRHVHRPRRRRPARSAPAG